MRRTWILAATAAAFIAGSLPATAQDGPSRNLMLANFLKVQTSVNRMVEAQGDFNDARAAGNQNAMRDAATTLLAEAGTAAFWAKVLDGQVTPENTNERIDASVSDLSAQTSEIYDLLDDVVLNNNMDELKTRLDDSGEGFNRMFNNTHSIWTEISRRPNSE